MADTNSVLLEYYAQHKITEQLFKSGTTEVYYCVCYRGHGAPVIKEISKDRSAVDDLVKELHQELARQQLNPDKFLPNDNGTSCFALVEEKAPPTVGDRCMKTVCRHLCRQLYELLVQPFGEQLECTEQLKHVYVAPDGLLHMLPFELLSPCEGRVWLDEEYCISCKYLCWRERERERQKGGIMRLVRLTKVAKT